MGGQEGSLLKLDTKKDAERADVMKNQQIVMDDEEDSLLDEGMLHATLHHSLIEITDPVGEEEKNNGKEEEDNEGQKEERKDEKKDGKQGERQIVTDEVS